MATAFSREIDHGEGTSASPRSKFNLTISYSVSDNQITFTSDVTGTYVSLYGSYYHYLNLTIYVNGTAYPVFSEKLLGYRSKSEGPYNKQTFSKSITTPLLEEGTSATFYAQSTFNQGGSDDSSHTLNMGSDAYQSSWPGFSWKDLGSGSETTTNISYSLSDYQVGYYYFTPTVNGTVTIYTSEADDSYGGIASTTSDGESQLDLSTSDVNGGSIVTGDDYILAQNDDSGGDSQFKCSDVAVTANTKYEIFVHNYYGDADSGTLHIDFTPYSYFSWVDLGYTSTPSNNETVDFDLTSNQVGYYWYYPPGDGTITIYSTGNTDTYGGFGTDMSLSSEKASGDSIVTGESYSCQDDINGSNDRNFICENIPVTGGDWAGQVFVHGYNNAASGTLHIDFTPYSWVDLGYTYIPSNNETVDFDLTSNQVGYYWYYPPGDGTITIYSTGNTDTYGGFGTDMSLSSEKASGDSIVTGESYSCQDDINGSNDRNFICENIPVTGGDWAGQVFVHGYNNAASGTLHIDFTPSVYIVTFDANGGNNPPDALSCAPGESITMPTEKPTRSGYIFLGWGAGKTSSWTPPGAIVGGTYTPDTTRTLYAIWGYTLTVNPNGGTMISGSDSSGAIETTSSYSTIGFTKTSTYGRWLGNFTENRRKYPNTDNYCQPIRTGYTFNNWIVTSGNGSVLYNAPGENFYSFYNNDKFDSVAHSGSTYGYYYYINNETNPTHSTITAQWTANTYTVTYDVNGGNALSTTTKTVTYDSTYKTLPTPTRTGYTFKGWYTAASGGTKITASSTVSTASDHTLYAQWTAKTFTITFNANGGDTPNPTTKTVTYDSTYRDLATCTRTGYTFNGWYTADSGGTQVTTDTKVTIAQNQTLYAQWTVNTYKLTVYPQSGTWEGSTSSQSFNIAYNSTRSIPVPTRTGYYFGGWMTSAYGTLDNSSFQQSAILSSSHNLTVYDNNNSGTITIAWIDNTNGDSPTLYGKDYVTITKTTGTASPDLGGFKRTVTPIAGATYYHTIYAKIPKGYTIQKKSGTIDGTFTWLTDQAGTGSWKIYAYKLVVNSSAINLGAFGYITLKADSGSTTDAVTWYVGANQITKSPTAAQTFTPATNASYLYASWIPNKYSITYNANGGFGTTSTSTHYYGYSKKLTKNAFTRTGYRFIGWSTQASATTATYTDQESVSNLTTVNEDSITLFAIWKPIAEMYIAIKDPTTGKLEFKPAEKFIYRTS